MGKKWIIEELLLPKLLPASLTAPSIGQTDIAVVLPTSALVLVRLKYIEVRHLYLLG